MHVHVHMNVNKLRISTRLTGVCTCERVLYTRHKVCVVCLLFAMLYIHVYVHVYVVHAHSVETK